jgi:pyridoxal phosphate enzyme (YggS family)
MDSIASRIDAVRERIAAAARQAGRPPEEVCLVAVTKTHPPEVIAAAIAAGQRDFGENRVQEAEAKIAALSGTHPAITWHLIGHLQTNKARRAAALFDIVHSVDSAKLAAALDRHAAERMKDEDARMKGMARDPHPSSFILHPLPILLQVNLSGEATKEGFALAGWEERPELLEAFFAEVERILALPHLAVQGLMTIAPWGDDPQAARPTFRSARKLRDELARRFGAAEWPALSMGMTDDFEVAIEEGATIVRVGRAIFGERDL